MTLSFASLLFSRAESLSLISIIITFICSSMLLCSRRFAISEFQPSRLAYHSPRCFMELHSVRRIAIILTASFFTLAALLALLYGFGGGASSTGTAASVSLGVEEGTNVHRKLLLHRGTGMVEPNRIWGDNKCSKSDIVISQGPTAPLPSGIPTYTVEIMNMCVSGCDISAIHLTCGWFSSARLINPKLFKRLRYNDCLVNDGRPLLNGATISFQYANTFLYPLSVSSVVCI